MDLVESFNELLALAQNDRNISVAIGVNRDLFYGPELPFYRELKSSSQFNAIFELQMNLAGYSKDVHGQLNVITHLKTQAVLGAPHESVKNVKFRLTENKVELFDHYVF